LQSNSRKGTGVANGGQYQLSELELPTKRIGALGGGPFSPSSPGKSVLADMTYSIEMVGKIWSYYNHVDSILYFKRRSK
jgi:hypothetical protein